MSGCREEEKTAPSVLEPPELEVVHPRPRVIRRVVGQPSFVQSYERTSIYPKLTAFIEKWNVDIGDKVQKGDVLADLFVPELREMLQTKKATVQYDSDRVRLARKQVEVAAAEVKAARARLEEARSILGKYESEVERWEVQVKRLKREVNRTVVDPQILLESTNQWKSNIAALDAAKAAVVRAEAELLADEAKLAKAEVNVAVAISELEVAKSEARRLEAWVGYLKLLAPYDGIVVARNANTWDFVLPTTGDPTAIDRAPDLSPSGQAAPIYVVERTDIVRIYVDIPERDANSVHVGSSARVKIWAYRDAWLQASVTRLSWALNARSRTLRAEIDLPNPGSQVLPGMYAYGEVEVEHPGAWRCRNRPSIMPAGRPSSGGTRTAARSVPRSRPAPPTASGSRSPTAASRRKSHPWDSRERRSGCRSRPPMRCSWAASCRSSPKVLRCAWPPRQRRSTRANRRRRRPARREPVKRSTAVSSRGGPHRSKTILPLPTILPTGSSPAPRPARNRPAQTPWAGWDVPVVKVAAIASSCPNRLPGGAPHGTIWENFQEI